MRNRVLLGFLITLYATLATGSGICSYKSDDKPKELDDSVRSLAGLKGVTVEVWKLPESVRAAGISDDTMRAEVEMRLRDAGIRLLGNEESSREGGAMLAVNVDLNTSKQGYHGISFSLYLRQSVILKRDRRIEISKTTTWTVGVFGTGPADFDIAGSVREHVVKHLCGEFIDAYFQANPKRGDAAKTKDKRPGGESK